jgi:hypothetical protein
LRRRKNELVLICAFALSGGRKGIHRHSLPGEE